jgi:hypothetical protein
MLSGVMLSGFMLSAFMLSGVMLSAFMLSGVMLSGVMLDNALSFKIIEQFSFQFKHSLSGRQVMFVSGAVFEKGFEEKEILLR